MKNLSSEELKIELKKYVYEMADELSIGLKENKKSNFNKYTKTEELCIK